MPNIKAAEKWALQSEKRAMRNKSVKGRLKTLFKSATAAGEPTGARTVQGAFDKAAAKGIIHPNKAARKKSRLAKALARAAVTPAAGPKTKSTRSKSSPRNAYGSALTANRVPWSAWAWGRMRARSSARSAAGLRVRSAMR